MTAAPTALPADLEAGLKRLKLATVRRIAPEILQTATTQRWKPDEILRTLVEAEIAARDEANRRARHRQAGLPVAKTFDGFDIAASSVPPATVDYLAGLEWVRAPENLCLVGPAGTGKSHPADCRRPPRRRSRPPGALPVRRRARRDPLPRPSRQQGRPRHRLAAAQRRRARR